MADFDDRFSAATDSDADVRAALASYNDRSKSMAERVGLSSSYASEDQSTQSRRLSPQSTDIAQLPPVNPPNLQNMPDPRQYGMGANQQQESPFKVFFNPMVLLGAASSLLTRKPLMAAMNYATGAMNGFNQGQNEVFAQNQVKFRDALAEAVAQNKVEMDRYNSAWDRRSVLTSENTAKLYAAASQNQDEAMQAAIKSQNWPLVEKMMLMKQQADERMRIAEAINKVRNDPSSADPETSHWLGLQLLEGNTQALTGLGLTRGAKYAAEKAARDIAINEGFNGKKYTEEEAAKFVADQSNKFFGERQYQRTAGGYAARVESATNEVEQLLPQALETSKNLPRGKFVPLNQLIQQWQQGISDPAYNDFIFANFSLMNAYARAMNPTGTALVNDKLESKAQGILSIATDPKAYETQARRLWLEVQASKKAQAETRQGLSEPKPFPGGQTSQQQGFTGRTATNPQTGEKRRETTDGQWVP